MISSIQVNNGSSQSIKQVNGETWINGKKVKYINDEPVVSYDKWQIRYYVILAFFIGVIAGSLIYQLAR